MAHRIRLLIHLFLWQTVFSLLPQDSLAQCTLRFSGRVLDADTRAPLRDASIEMEGGAKISTDSNGNFLINGVCPGRIDVVISHVGCITQTYHFHLKEDFYSEFSLPHAANELSEVVVVGQGKVSQSGFSQQVSGMALDRTRGQSLAESMQQVTGVSMLQTGTNIYKPVIHGLHSNRVIILNNGIRQEGQQWGSEHAPEIDPFIANRISVIKGAASLRYGSDAIGGVVLVEPRLLPVLPGTSGEVNIAGFSNNRQGVLSAMMQGNVAKYPGFAWRLQGSVKKGGNARTPDYRLANSGIEEYNFSATAGKQKPGKGIELFVSQFNTKLGIFSGSHIGNVTDLVNVINSGQPPEYVRDAGFTYKIDRPYQEIQHTLGKIKAFKRTGDIGRLNLLLSVQHNKRKEFDLLRFSGSSSEPQLDMDLVTIGTDVVWDHFAGEKWRGTVGVNGSYQRNLYFNRFFIPNYQALNGGVFVIEKYTVGKWMLEGGVRYDLRSIVNTDRNNGFNYGDKHFKSLSANGGATYRLNEHWKAETSISTAWRAPQVNELYSDGLHHGAARIEKGNESLKPERANSLMAGLVYEDAKLSVDAGVYYKRIDDFIFLRPDYPPQLTIRGAFPSFVYEQTNARLSGLDFSVKYIFNPHIIYTGKASLLRAWDRTQNDWLVQMPADRFDNDLEYQFSDLRQWKQSYIRLSVHTVLEQTRFPETGNIEVTKPDGTVTMEADYALPPAAYNLVGIEWGTTYAFKKQPVQFMLGASNLFNKTYRDYLNAFRYFSDDMGRNIYLKIKIPIGSSL